MLRIIPLECGRMSADKAQMMIGGEGEVILPVSSWLVDHPAGRLVFDTGLHPDLQTDTSRIGRSAEMFGIDFALGEELSGRLVEAEVDPADVDLMVFSHLHFDHCGGTALVPDARVLVQRTEWEVAHKEKLVAAGVYNPDDFDLGHEVQLLEGEHDVFGDGRVICVPTPGHTAGHQSLRVQLDSGPVVLTADCIYFEDQLQLMTTPPFGHDTEQQLASMKKLAAMADRGDRLIFGHDVAQWEALPKELT